MDRFKNKKILVVGIGKTGFALIHFFNQLGCDIRVTDIKPIFDLNKEVKKLKKFEPILINHPEPHIFNSLQICMDG